MRVLVFGTGKRATIHVMCVGMAMIHITATTVPQIGKSAIGGGGMGLVIALTIPTMYMEVAIAHHVTINAIHVVDQHPIV